MDAAVERVHEAARLLLVRGPDGRTRWLSHASHDLPPLGISHAPSTPVTLRPKTTVSRRSNCLDLDASRFPDKRSVFRLVQPIDGAPEAQNLLLLLHGRGDSHEPFARLGEHMALPQTAVVSLRAPLELPFGLGRSWVDDLDETGDVIPPDRPHERRSQSLEAAKDYVWSFLRVLHDRYAWDYSRLFLFAFSQGACVAFHLAMTLPRDVRLGGVVLAAGGAVAGSHSSSCSDPRGGAVATPMLQVTGDADNVYPVPLTQRSRRDFARRHSETAAAELFTSVVRPHKGHAMIDAQEDMRHVMRFFSKHLYLRNIALENCSDVVEIQT
ncbi:unnamed protein product [Hyaloperonospora brassicae]|uniref:Phospholipase/carboxylesterase/thioesterase domain-containing protein n=1 Tax=Hyaloperonospora brassicae TaxID=162125 RepID=A0AAV0U0U5_HYABA|nr:unnamed protein product [Hyaloperonospora brassicae]